MTSKQYASLLATAIWLVPAVKAGGNPNRGCNWIEAWDLAYAMMDAGIV